MIEGETTGKLDFQTLREAIERRDPDAMLAFYTEDASLRIENAALPGGPAFELEGRAQIGRYLRTVCDQEMTCAILDGDADEGKISFSETCEYADGNRVLVRTTLGLRDGRISCQLDVVERRSRWLG